MHSKSIETVAIFGGSGFLGQLLLRVLENNGYKVLIFSRNKTNPNHCIWNPALKQFPIQKLKEIDHMINLSGANLMTNKWTPEYKKILLESRTQPNRFLLNLLSEHKHTVKSFTSASGISIYGDRGDVVLTEKDEPGVCFLEKLCVNWEQEADQIRKLGIRTNVLRISPVVHKDSHFIAEQMKFAKFGLLGSVGSGHQYVSWIHHEDLTNMFVFLIQNDSCNDVFNASTSSPVTQKELNTYLGEAIKRKQFAPAIPTQVFKLFFGEKSQLIIDSIYAIPENFIEKGFQFKYPKIQDALKHL